MQPLRHLLTRLVGECRFTLFELLDIVLTLHPEGVKSDIAFEWPTVESVQGDGGDAAGSQFPAQLGEIVEGTRNLSTCGLEERLVVPEHLDSVLERNHVQRAVVETLVVQRRLPEAVGDT